MQFRGEKGRKRFVSSNVLMSTRHVNRRLEILFISHPAEDKEHGSITCRAESFSSSSAQLNWFRWNFSECGGMRNPCRFLIKLSVSTLRSTTQSRDILTKLISCAVWDIKGVRPFGSQLINELCARVHPCTIATLNQLEMCQLSRMKSRIHLNCGSAGSAN